MSKTQTKRMILLLTAALLSFGVLMAGVLICLSYFESGGNLREVDMRRYVLTDKDEQGQFTFSVNADGIIHDFHLPDPKTTELDISRYPDVAAVYSLVFVVTPQGEDSWQIETASSLADPAGDLKKGALVLTNTRWIWTKEQAEAAYASAQTGPRTISIRKYALCSLDYQDRYLLTIDKEALLKACRWELPVDIAAQEADKGYQAVMSLGLYVTETETGYRIETTSTLPEVVDIFKERGIEITDTTWNMTQEEVAALYAATRSREQEPINTPAPTDTPVPADTAPSTAIPTATPAASPTATPKPEQNTPRSLESRENVLSSLYGYDQTALREAIRKAKEAHYGADFKSSQVSYNYFITGKNASAEYGNCFSVIYTVKTEAGKTEYLRADVYDFGARTVISAEDVTLHTFASAAKARDNGDFPTSLYTVNTLNGGSMAFGENGGQSPWNDEGLIFENSLEEKLTTEELWNIPAGNNRTLEQLLGFARNEIFARCGHKFKETSSYYTFYSGYDWYDPQGSITYNDIRKDYPNACYNIDLIKKLESLIREG